MRAKKVFDNKLIGYVYFILNYNPRLSDRKSFVAKLISDVHETTIGFAGFKSKKYLQQYLQFQLFDDEEYGNLPKYNFDKKKILQIIEDTLLKCHNKLPAKPTRTFLLPSFNSFVKNEMNGVGGFSPWKNTILIDINPSVKNWETTLKNTIAHEYNHSVVYNFHKWESLLDSLIFEGFAEYFREQVVGGERAPWAKAVSRKECKKHFFKLKEKFNSKNHQLYREIFFGSEKYPLWLGYSLGYQIVKSFLSKNKDESWIDIVKIKPKDVLKQSNF